MYNQAYKKVISFIMVICMGAFCFSPSYGTTQSAQPKESMISIVNNAGLKDTIEVWGLISGDTVKVYTSPAITTPVGIAMVAAGKTSAVVAVDQLGTTSGSAFISVTSVGKTESSLTMKEYQEEKQSTAPTRITVVNNAGMADSIEVEGLISGDMVKVYTAPAILAPIATATVSKGKTSSEISIPQLGTGAGSVYISVTSTGKTESELTQKNYLEESKSGELKQSNITIVNNVGMKDSINITGLYPGDLINIYKAYTGSAIWAKATVEDGRTQLEIKVDQLGASYGSIFVSVTHPGRMESDRVEKSYDEEQSSSVLLDVKNILVTNNLGDNDLVKVVGLLSGDTIRVYQGISDTQMIGMGTVAKGKTSIILKVSALDPNGGNVYVSLANTGKSEGSRVLQTYEKEYISEGLLKSDIYIVNNANAKDTIKVVGLEAGDIIKVYPPDPLDPTKPASAYFSAAVAAGRTEVIITTQLEESGGSVFISLTAPGKLESEKIETVYLTADETEAPNVSNITITNNASVADTVRVTGLAPGTLVQVYDANDKIIGKGTVAAGKTEITISIKQLGTDKGNVSISATLPGKKESNKVSKDYLNEPESKALLDSQIMITNNAGNSDTAKVTGLAAKSVIKVYSQPTDGDVIGTATVGSGKTEVTVSIKQIGTTGGSLYVSLTEPYKAEGPRTPKSYGNESPSSEPITENVTVYNYGGISDLVVFTGLTAGTVVKVYASLEDEKAMGAATVLKGTTQAAVSVAQLDNAEEKIYVSITEPNCSESNRVEISFATELISTDLTPSNITVTNNLGINDQIKVVGLWEGDVVRIYMADIEKPIATATVAKGNTEVLMNVKSLAAQGGEIIATVARVGKLESNPLPISYDPEVEVESTPPAIQNIVVINNTGNDYVIVYGLQAGDLIKVYDSSDKQIATATVAAKQTQVIICIKQIGTGSGVLKISNTSLYKIESGQTEVTFLPE